MGEGCSGRRADRATRIRTLLAALLLLLPACVPTVVVDLPSVPAASSSPAVEPGGTLLLDGQEFHLSQCYSGDRDYFLGVDLRDASTGLVLRLVIDPLGATHVRITQRGTDGPSVLLLSPPECRDLHAEVEPTGWYVNKVRDVRGSVEGECRSESGARVQVSLRFSHCH